MTSSTAEVPVRLSCCNIASVIASAPYLDQLRSPIQRQIKVLASLPTETDHSRRWTDKRSDRYNSAISEPRTNQSESSNRTASWIVDQRMETVSDAKHQRQTAPCPPTTTSRGNGGFRTGSGCAASPGRSENRVEGGKHQRPSPADSQVGGWVEEGLQRRLPEGLAAAQGSGISGASNQGDQRNSNRRHGNGFPVTLRPDASTVKRLESGNIAAKVRLLKTQRYAPKAEPALDSGNAARWPFQAFTRSGAAAASPTVARVGTDIVFTPAQIINDMARASSRSQNHAGTIDKFFLRAPTRRGVISSQPARSWRHKRRVQVLMPPPDPDHSAARDTGARLRSGWIPSGMAIRPKCSRLTVSAKAKLRDDRAGCSSNASWFPYRRSSSWREPPSRLQYCRPRRRTGGCHKPRGISPSGRH